MEEKNRIFLAGFIWSMSENTLDKRLLRRIHCLNPWREEEEEEETVTHLAKREPSVYINRKDKEKNKMLFGIESDWRVHENRDKRKWQDIGMCFGIVS